MVWRIDDCERHWAKRRSGYTTRTIADCGWNHHREYMQWNNYEKCFDLTLHRTVVVQVFPDKYKVNCGGWWTQITKKKIEEWSGVKLGGAWRGNYIETEFVHYNNKIVSVYYPHMECDLYGMPLKPLAAHVYRVRKGSTDEFNQMAKRVRQHLAPRILIGEFEQMEGNVHDGDDLYELMREVDAGIGGLFPTFLPTDKLAPLFVQRPLMAFGTPRGERHRPWAPAYEGDPERTGMQCLLSNIAAAKRHWMGGYTNHDKFYEKVEKEFA